MSNTIDVGRLWLDRAYQYAFDIRSGAIPACMYVQLAVERWFRDLETGASRGLYFSEAHAARYFRFVGRYCRHHKGELAGQLIDLEPWQCFADANLFGWIRTDGTRRFRMSHEEVGRKNGKTTRLSAAGNYYLIADGEGGSEVYSAATKKDQAREIFDCSREMIRKSASLRTLADAQEHKILSNGGKYAPLSRDSKSMDGFNVHAGLVDELHAHPNSAIWDVLRSAMGARKQPILRGITTAGFDRKSFCYTRREYAIKVLEGSIDDDALFAIIYTLDDIEKWDDESEWIKANPNLGVSVDMDDLRAQCEEAKHIPTSKVEFLTKRLNIWVYGQTAWMPMLRWNAARVDFDALSPWLLGSASELDGMECFGGLDLASVDDLCSFALTFPMGERRRVIQRSYLPQEAMERRLRNGDKTMEQYREGGQLIITPGHSVDYNWIKKDIKQMRDRFDIKGIAYDRWNSSQLVKDLEDEGFNMIKFGQGHGSMNAPTKELLRLTLDGKIEHNDPLLTWAMSNVVVDTNPAGDIKPDKSKVSEKIDPAVAVIQSIALAMGIDEKDQKDPKRLSKHLAKHGIRKL